MPLYINSLHYSFGKENSPTNKLKQDNKMKLLPLLLLLAFSNAQADAYMCKDNGKTTFKDTPCETSGEKFDYGDDISIAQQRAAIAKNERKKQSYAARKQAEYEARQRERIIRIEENKVSASYANARAGRAQAFQQRRTANAIHNRNFIEAAKY